MFPHTTACKFKILLNIAIIVLIFAQILSPSSAKSRAEDEDLGSFVPVWWETFGGGQEDDGASVLALDDGSLVVAGYTHSYGSGQADAWLISTNATGVELWNRTFGGSGFDFGQDVLRTDDGGFLLAATTTSFGAGMMDAWLIKTDNNGTEEWSHTYGGIKDDKVTAISPTSDGGYIITGHSNSYTDGWSNVMVLKVNASGVEEWSAYFGGEANDEGTEVVQVPDGGYLVTGTTKTYGAGESDVWVLKLNASGGEEWNRTFGGVYDDLGNTMIQTSDGNFVISAQTRSFGATDEDFFGIRTDDIWLIKIDPAGKMLWNRTVGGLWYEYGDALLENPDGSLMIAGSSGTFQGEIFNIILYKMDPAGVPQWYKSLGGKDYDFGSDIAVTPDGNYAVSGYTMSHGAGASDAVLMIFDPKPPAPVINQPPTVAITKPVNNEKVSGMVKIKGTADDDSYYLLISVRFDNGTWISVSEDKSWYFFYNTTKLDDGEHTIYARSYDGSLFSDNATVTIMVDNGKVPVDNVTDDDGGEKEDEEEPFLFAGLGVVLLIIILFIIIGIHRSKQKKQ